MTRNNKDMIGKTFGFFTFFTCCVELEHFLSRFVKMGRFRNKWVSLDQKVLF